MNIKRMLNIWNLLYPRTAQIYYGLYDMYKKESDIERSDAENGR